MASSLALDSTPGAAIKPKATQILDAARQVFMDQGYGATSMDTIARVAGVSKATLYSHFSGKDELFAAMIASECARHAQALAAPDLETTDLRAALIRIGRDFLALLVSPKGLAIYRVVVAETPRFPELGQAFYRSGPAVMIQLLADFLLRTSVRHRLALEDPWHAAEQFLGMLKVDWHLKALLGVVGSVPESAIDATVEGAVDTFLSAYRRGESGALTTGAEPAAATRSV